MLPVSDVSGTPWPQGHCVCLTKHAFTPSLTKRSFRGWWTPRRNVAIISPSLSRYSLPPAITVSAKLRWNFLAEITTVTAAVPYVLGISAPFFISEETSLPPPEPSRRRWWIGPAFLRRCEPVQWRTKWSFICRSSIFSRPGKSPNDFLKIFLSIILTTSLIVFLLKCTNFQGGREIGFQSPYPSHIHRKTYVNPPLSPYPQNRKTLSSPLLHIFFCFLMYSVHLCCTVLSDVSK